MDVSRARLPGLVPTEAWRGFAHRGGFVSPPDALECLGVVDALGECGDRACGTHRLTKPGVRRNFVDRVCAAYAASPAAATRHLRYASVGAGLFAAPKTKTGEQTRVRLNGAFRGWKRGSFEAARGAR